MGGWAWRSASEAGRNNFQYTLLLGSTPGIRKESREKKRVERELGWGEYSHFLVSYLLVQEILNDEAPEVREGHVVASSLPGLLLLGVVLQLLCGQHPYLTAADPSRGTFNGALQRLLGPGWILVECRDAPADGGDACELEDAPPCHIHPQFYSLTQTCPWNPPLTHSDPLEGRLPAPYQRLHPISWISLPTQSSLCVLPYLTYQVDPETPLR